MLSSPVIMNARGKSVDKTFLSLDNAEKRGFLHRDYIAHCFRWSHACKMIQKNWRDAIILDVGCGKEMPFPKLIYSSKMRPQHYCGLDVGDWPKPEMLEDITFPCDRLVGDIAGVKDFKDLDLPGPPNFITCFEVLEHVEWDHARRALEVIRAICAKDALFMVSTPTWNFKDCADNHVNEMTYAAFGALLEDCDWEIEQHYGTFASQSDLKKVFLTDGWAEQAFNALHEYYDSNVLSVIFAPAFPVQSRNVIWDCRPGLKVRKFPKLETIDRPWGSGETNCPKLTDQTGRSKL
jgi:hypothetical protein